MHLNNLRGVRLSILHILIALAGTLSFLVAISIADDAPTTQPGLDYKPGVDQVMTQLRDLSTRESAERIIRGFPEAALPIAKDDLANQFSDLPADVRADVTHIIDRNHEARAHVKVSDDAELKWNETTLTDTYQKVGLRNPAWDNDALTAMISFVRINPDMALFRKAQRAGCQDQLFRYCFARSLQITTGERYAKRMDQAADALLSSNYPASRKCFGLLNAVKADFPTKSSTPLTDSEFKSVQSRLDAALKLFPAACKEPGMPPQLLSELAGLLQEGYFKATGDRLTSINTVYPVVAAALPQSTIPLDLKGSVYIDFAWDARGGGFANTVTPERAKLMQERLKIARDTLTQAAAKDSFDFAAPTSMLSVVLGDESGQPEMEKWFINAQEANPDHRPAYNARMNFLEPKWYGSREAMLAFGHECVATQNFTANLPTELASAHLALAYYADGGADPFPRGYFKSNPSIWDDVCAGFVPALYLDPDNYHNRSLFARYAIWCGQYDEANHQFTLLGDHADPKIFTSRAQLIRLRNEAKTHSASTRP